MQWLLIVDVAQQPGSSFCVCPVYVEFFLGEFAAGWRVHCVRRQIVGRCVLDTHEMNLLSMGLSLLALRLFAGYRSLGRSLQ